MIKARRSYFQTAPIVKLILELHFVFPSYFKSMEFAISLCPSSPATRTPQHSVLHTCNYCMGASTLGTGGSSMGPIKMDRATVLHPHDDPCLMPILYLRYEIVYPAPHPTSPSTYQLPRTCLNGEAPCCDSMVHL
jgi:hypothetical protein